MQYEPGVFPLANLENAGQRSQQIKGAKSKHYTNNENMYNMSHGISGYSALAAMFGREDGSRAQGALYDVQDLSKLYQDKLRTTPVTALEQPVGSVTDISGNGNHAYQATAANRPIVSARYNKCRAANYNPTDLTGVLKGGDAAAILTLVDDRVELARAGLTNPCTGGVVYKLDNSAGVGNAYATIAGGAGTANSHRLGCWARREAGSVRVQGNIGLGSVAVNNAFYSFVEVTGVATSTEQAQIFAFPGGVIYFIMFDMREASDVSLNIPQVQLLSGSGIADYDSNSFPKYLKGNGTTQFLQTDAIDFTGTDKMTVIVGVGKLSDAAAGMLVEASTNTGANPGSFRLTTSNPGATYENVSAGTAISSMVSPTNYAAPINNVVSGVSSISEDVNTLRVNGVSVGNAPTDQGNGNYGNYPLFILARSGAVFFGGRLYGLAICGRSVNPYPLFLAEEEMGSKMGIELS